MARWSAVRVVGLVAVVVGGALVAPAGVAAAATSPADVWSSEYDGAGNASFNAGATALTATTSRSVALRWTRPDAVGTNRAPSIVGDVGYEVVNSGTAAPSHFEAFSTTTGATLWSTVLPTDGSYHLGETIAGHVAVMSFDGQYHDGGVSAVDLATHRLLWSVPQQPAGNPDWGTQIRSAGPVVTDGTRVFMFGGTNTVNTFRLSDGARLWTLPATDSTAQPDGIAYAGGHLFVGGGEQGVTAYDPATGREQWTAPGVGAPVVAGGRVITASGPEFMAVAVAGCGKTRCGTLWDTVLPGDVSYPMVGGVDGSTGYVTYTVDQRQGRIARFSTVTGRLLWKASILPDASTPVRGASTVWTVAGGTTLVGFSTTATGSTPLRSIVEPADRQEGSQTLAIAGRSVFVRTFPRQLTAYGLPTG